MPFSLYDAVIPPFRQMVINLAALIDKAATHCAERGIAPETLLEARLAVDMLPFTYQVKSIGVHSLGAIEGAQQGLFRPDVSPPPASFSALVTRLTMTDAALAAFSRAEINGLEGRPLRLEIGHYHADYTAEQFLMSFSKPNFYFHATTAYDILRLSGMAIGKPDYLGRLQLVKSVTPG